MPILAKLESFGWHCQEIDGHSIADILGATRAAQAVTDLPSVIVARTLKGKGVPFMEGNNAWHKGAPDEEQYREAMMALGGVG